ncbi:MAG: hypothetical protein A3I05_03360 [Deltaproteobacteria bacterium RIFCSPLOWO2_02_FULL_44_10]|nr:MAG: hypothetical protein A3C46_02935 [Deltaproteobacteria bacterium RIFCSPHIGHO2_02_FULL_44_16]OGQ46211.1 MAG: hypothetical protein A3I05_03360 [Deltaproteobacteria bacterium RIFCSPLOWO2_02_FULL_44_10]
MRVLTFLCVFSCFTACGQISLYQDLSEEDANEMLVLLSEHNIKANKKKETRQNEIFYSVEVSPNDMPRSRQLLVEHNLPRRRELGLDGVYKEKGLIPTPDEQKARYLLALKGEIINSLERIPDVVDVDVVLNLPTQDEFASRAANEIKRPTASAIIKAKPGLTVRSAISEAKIQQFVANAIEGLNPRDVSVIISYISSGTPTLQPGDVLSLTTPTREGSSFSPEEQGQELLGLSLNETSKSKLKLYFLIFFLLLVLLSTALIIVIVQGSRLRRELSQTRDMRTIEGRVVETPRQLQEGEEEEL